MPQVCAGCFAQACIPGSPGAPGSFAHLEPSVGEKQPGGVAGMLQAAVSRELDTVGDGCECRVPGAGHNPFQAHPEAAVPCGCTSRVHFLERENHLAEEFPTLKLLENYFILYSHTTGQKY